MTTYSVTVERDGRFWFIDVADVGVTQARHLREVDTMVRDLVSLRDVAPDSFEFDIHIVTPDRARVHVERAEQLRVEADRAREQATGELRAAARSLSDQGLPLRDVGELLGMSHQRVHQLLSTPDEFVTV